MTARRVRRLAVVVVVLLVIGVIAVVLTTRPKLDDRRNDVDRGVDATSGAARRAVRPAR